MIGTFVLRGIGAGLVAGLAAGLFAFAFGEPLLDDAIALESVGAPPAHDADALVSRDAQKFGLFLATGIYGLALGGLFALVFAVARGRVRARSDVWLCAGLAAALFIAVVVVPFLKYPPAPPGVGDPATITDRTLLYITLVAASLLALLSGWRTARSLPARVGARSRALAGAAVFLALVVIVSVALPGIDPAPDTYPSDLLREFRLTSLGVQAILWASLGLAFGMFASWRR